MSDADPAARDIAMVFQSYALFPNMTVAGFIGTPRMNLITLPVAGGVVWFGSQKIALPDATTRKE